MDILRDLASLIRALESLRLCNRGQRPYDCVATLVRFDVVCQQMKHRFIQTILILTDMEKLVSIRLEAGYKFPLIENF